MNAKHDEEKSKPIAIALRYDAEDRGVPDVVGKGSGEVAERILKLAEEHDIPVREDPDLLQLLAGVQVGESIPEELYGVVAEVLTFLYRVNTSME